MWGTFIYTLSLCIGSDEFRLSCYLKGFDLTQITTQIATQSTQKNVNKEVSRVEPESMGPHVLLLPTEESERKARLDVPVPVNRGRDTIDDTFTDVGIARQAQDSLHCIVGDVVHRVTVRLGAHMVGFQEGCEDGKPGLHHTHPSISISLSLYDTTEFIRKGALENPNKA
jgi:hypothetical protein